LEKLEDDPYIGAAPGGELVFGEVGDVTAVHPHFSCAGMIDAGDHVQQRRLPVSRRPDDGDELPAGDLQRDLLQDEDDLLADEVIFIDVFQFDEWLHTFVFVSMLTF
jgi:hypothetical protein